MSTGIFEASERRPIPLQRRSDLVASCQVFRNESFWLVKDPLDLKFHLLNEEEFGILQLVDGTNSAQDIRREFEARFKPQRITPRQLQTFIADLRRKSLLAFTGGDVTSLLLEQKKTQQLSQLKQRLLGFLAMKWRGIDPDRLLTQIQPSIGLLFSLPAVIFGCLIIGMALAWMLVQHSLFVSRLPGLSIFLSSGNWLLLGTIFVGMKVVHELAHGIALKRYGGQCNEIGVLLFMGFIPTLYCSTSDAWLLKSKWKRAAIGAAGMYAELLMMSLATLGWWFTKPGTLNLAFLNIIAAGAVSVILLNGNPFFKFDGYYILSDVLELPNLHQRARKQMRSFLMRWGLGMDEPSESNSTRSTKLTLLAYATTSFLFKLVFLSSIVFLLIDRLAPVGLAWVGAALGTVGLAMLILPLITGLYQLVRVPGQRARIETKYASLSVLGVSAVMACFFCVPLPHHVNCGFTIESHDGHPIYVQHDAAIHRVHVRPGQQVRTGQLLVELRNVDRQLELSQMRMKLFEERAELELLSYSRRSSSSSDTARAKALRESIRTRKAGIDELEQVVSSFRVTASRGGTVITAWHEDDSALNKGSESRDGSLLEERREGSWITAGTRICTIGDLSHLDAVMAINEHDVSLLRQGQSTVLMLDGLAGKRWSGSLSSIARQSSEGLPANLADRFGGSIATEAVNQRGRISERPSDEHFEARVALPAGTNPLSTGLRGTARIHVGNRTLFQRAKLAFYRSSRPRF